MTARKWAVPMTRDGPKSQEGATKTRPGTTPINPSNPTQEETQSMHNMTTSARKVNDFTGSEASKYADLDGVCREEI
jgi:hypothetical protein